MKKRKQLKELKIFLTTNIIISISSDETADSEELKAFISKNEFKSIEFIASMFLKQSKEIEELKEEKKLYIMKLKNMEKDFNEFIEKYKENEE